MFYPSAVIVAAFIVTTILLYFVVPQFESLFKGFGADLPAMTQMVVNMSKVVQAYWWAMLLAVIGAVFAFIEGKKRSPKINHFLDRLELQIPIIGAIVNKATIARYSLILSTMFAAGVPLVEAMATLAAASGNIIYTNAIMRMRDEVAPGVSLQMGMRQSELFTNKVVQKEANGEEAASLDAMLS